MSKVTYGQRGIEVDWTDGPTVPRMEDDGEDADMKLEKTGDHTYVDEDGIEYDLSELEDFGDYLSGSLLHLYARKDGREASIITDKDGEGRWTTYYGPSGLEYRQIAGTMQYRLPDTDKAICAQLRRDLPLHRTRYVVGDHRSIRVGQNHPAQLFGSHPKAHERLDMDGR